MCTLTWIIKQDGYQLFFNRDELGTRQQAQLPSVHTINGIKVICPIDSDAGGTWISTNQHRLSLALLNKYECKTRGDSSGLTSRGILVRELSSLVDQKDVAGALRSINLSVFKAFDMIAFEPDRTPVLMTWNGIQLEQIPEPQMPITSSSYQTREVISARKKYFERFMVDREASEQTLESFHASHSPDRGPYSVCMHRQDAQTVSFCKIDVAAGKTSFSYTGGSLCENNQMQQLRLLTMKHLSVM